jgi:hypothetical protein
MPSSAKQAKPTALDAVRATPFMRVHGRLTRKNYKILKEDTSALASKVKDIIYLDQRCNDQLWSPCGHPWIWQLLQADRHRHLRCSQQAHILRSNH